MKKGFFSIGSTLNRGGHITRHAQNAIFVVADFADAFSP